MSVGIEIFIWALLVIASITDLLYGKIFNLLTVPFLGIGLIAQGLIGGMTSVATAVAAVAVAFAIYFPLYLAHAFSAGDVKLLMAAGAWSSSASFVVALGAIAIVLGGMVGLIVLMHALGIKKAALNVVKHIRVLELKKLSSHRMPFAPAFLAAFILIKIAEMNQWLGF